MIAVVIVIALAAGLMGSAATDNGATIQKNLNAAQAAVLKAAPRR